MDYLAQLTDPGSKRNQFIHLDAVEEHRVERETMVLCLERNIINKWTSAHITEFRRMWKGMADTILPACRASEGSADEQALLASTSYLVVQGVRGQDGAPWAVDYVHVAITTPSSPPVGSLVFFENMARVAEILDLHLCHAEGRHPLFTGLPFLQANASGQRVNDAFLKAARSLVPLFRRVLFGARDPVPDSLVVSSVQACTNIAIGFSKKSKNGMMTSQQYYSQSFARCALLLLYNIHPDQYQPIGAQAYHCFAERQSGAMRRGRKAPRRVPSASRPSRGATPFQVAKRTGITSAAALEALVQCIAAVCTVDRRLLSETGTTSCTSIEGFVVLCEYKQLRKHHSVHELRDLVSSVSNAQIRSIVMSMERKGPKLCHARHIVTNLLAQQNRTTRDDDVPSPGTVFVDSSDEDNLTGTQRAAHIQQREGDLMEEQTTAVGVGDPLATVMVIADSDEESTVVEQKKGAIAKRPDCSQVETGQGLSAKRQKNAVKRRLLQSPACEQEMEYLK